MFRNSCFLCLFSWVAMSNSCTVPTCAFLPSVLFLWFIHSQREKCFILKEGPDNNYIVTHLHIQKSLSATTVWPAGHSAAHGTSVVVKSFILLVWGTKLICHRFDLFRPLLAPIWMKLMFVKWSKCFFVIKRLKSFQSCISVLYVFPACSPCICNLSSSTNLANSWAL